MVKYQKPQMKVESIEKVDVILASSAIPDPTQAPTQRPTIWDEGVEI